MTDPVALARALRQRIELGAPPLFLDGLARGEVAELIRAGRLARAAGPAAVVALAPPEPEASASSLRGEAVAAPRIATDTTEAPEAPADAPADDGPAPGDLDAESLREAVLTCTRCRLHQTRTQAVFADGVPDARVMVVGEAPGANEDRTGLPFVGAAGKLLDLMLASVDLSRASSVYICNVIKCRPPGNRNPQQDEIDTCSPYLRRQIDLVEPEVILAVGTFAAQLLTGRRDSALGTLRGAVHAYEGVPLVVTYHPAALLRNRGWTRPTWDDLQLLRRVLEGS